MRYWITSRNCRIRSRDCLFDGLPGLLVVTILYRDWFMQAKRDYPVRRRKDHAMAKNRKWSKLVARIQALEDALAGLLSAKPPRKRKKSKTKSKTQSAAGKRKTAKPAKAAPRKTSRPAAKTARRARRKSARAIMAEAMPIVPGMPVGSL
jgi:hypothetical protein